jgi:hypothetical protein
VHHLKRCCKQQPGAAEYAASLERARHLRWLVASKSGRQMCCVSAVRSEQFSAV